MKPPMYREAGILLIGSVAFLAFALYMLVCDIQRSLGTVVIFATAYGLAGLALLVATSGNRVKCRL